MNIQPTQLARMRHEAISIFNAGLKAVEPQKAVSDRVHRDADRLTIGTTIYDLNRINHIYVIGAGKATAPMAAAIERILGDRLTVGRIVVKYGYGCHLDKIELVEAGHPVPDHNGQAGAESLLKLAHSAQKNDLVIGLISGGGSALLPMPAPGLTLADKQATSKTLLACGADIEEINTIRKHMSAIKGGQLAQAIYPAQLVCLMLSDVVGDAPQIIASGPTAPDQSRFEDCLQIVAKYHLQNQLPKNLVQRFTAGANGKLPETPKPHDPIFEQVLNHIIGSNTSAILTAKQKALELGYSPLVLSCAIEGETRDIAGMHAAIAREILTSGNPIPSPACLLSGGETTVNITGGGLGGRNQEFALTAALAVNNHHHIVILSAGTDGTDGPTDAAGALADSTTITRAVAKQLDARTYLADNDSYHFFQALGDLFITGPTRTNVMDIRVFLVSGRM